VAVRSILGASHSIGVTSTVVRVMRSFRPAKYRVNPRREGAVQRPGSGWIESSPQPKAVGIL